MTQNQPTFRIEGREYSSFEDLWKAQAGGEDRSREASYAVTADNAERMMIGVEGLPDPDNLVGEDDDQDGRENA